MILGKASSQGASVSSSVKWKDWTWSMGCKKMLGQEVWCYRTNLGPYHCNQSRPIFIYFPRPVSESSVSDNRTDHVLSGLFLRSKNIRSPCLSAIQATRVQRRSGRQEQKGKASWRRQSLGRPWGKAVFGKTEGRRKQSTEERHSGMFRHPEDKTHLGWSWAWRQRRLYSRAWVLKGK